MISKINIATWNANSLNGKRNLLTHFMKIHDVHIMLINETKLKANDKFNINGYQVLRNDRPSETASGGVCAIISNKIPFVTITLPMTTLETVGFKLLGGIHIISAYNPPSNHFTLTELNKLMQIGKRVILAGDLNSKHTNWGCQSIDTNGRTLNQFLLSSNSNLLFTDEPTHFPENFNTPSTIDIVIAKNVSNISNPEAVAELTSDHNPILLRLTNQQINEHTINIRTYSDTNWNHFRKYLDNSINLTPDIKSKESLEAAVKQFSHSIQKAQTKHSKTKIINPQKVDLTPEILDLIKHKNNLRKAWQRSADPVVFVMYKRCVREVSQAVSNHKNNIWKSKLQKLSARNKTLWKFCKKLRKQHISIPNLKTNTNTAFTDQDKANLLAETFSNMGLETLVGDEEQHVNIIHQVDEFIDRHANAPANKNYLTKIISSPQEVQSIIKTLPNNKAPGLDHIDNKIVKNISKKAIIQLTYIINNIFKLKYFPSCWKTALAIPLPKPGKNSSDPENYRIISLLSVLSKITEKIMLDRLKSHIKRRKLLINEQFGFREGHNTIMQVARITNDIIVHYNKGYTTQMSLLDICKAFDTVWIHGLVHKLIKHSFPAELIVLLNSYLRDRKLKIKVNAAVSNEKILHAGVPQGSVLGPTLFILFINDIIRFPKTKLALFADDTAVYSHSFWAEVGNRQNQIQIDMIEKFFKEWKIKLNPSKTESITFTRKYTNCKVFKLLRVANHSIQISDKVKYLGITLDKRLSFIPHISELLKKGFIVLRLLYPLLASSSVNKENKRLLYTTIIRPIITYGAPLFCSVSNTQFQRLQIFQNKCTRLITGCDRYTSIRSLHRMTNLPPIKDYIIALSNAFYEKQIKHSILTRDITRTHHRLTTTDIKHPLIYKNTKFYPY